MDRDSIGADFLGECRVPLKKLCSGIEKSFNYYLDEAIPVSFLSEDLRFEGAWNVVAMSNDTNSDIEG